MARNITAKEIIDIANDKTIRKSINITQCISLVKEYVDEVDKSKTDKIISIFPSLPQPIQINIIDICLKHYMKEFGILCVNKCDKTPMGDIFTPLYYYI